MARVVVADVATAVIFSPSAVGTAVPVPRNAVVLLESMVPFTAADAAASAASVKVTSAVTGVPAAPEV